MGERADFREYKLSKHATTRVQQRGVRQWVVDSLFNEADVEHPVGGGCRALTLSRRRVVELRGEGASVGELEVLGRHFLVISPDGTIVTIGKVQSGTKGRHYRRW